MERHPVGEVIIIKGRHWQLGVSTRPYPPAIT
jgi:hypothetical protein